MSLRFCDSFDHYGQDYILSKWTSVFNFGTGGQGLILDPTHQRTGPQCGGFTGNGAFKTIDNQPEWILGAAFSLSAYGGRVQFININVLQVEMAFQSDGTIAVFNGPNGFNPGVLLGTTSPSVALVLNRYYYIEFRSKMNNGLGTAIVKINGQTVLSLSGVNTSQTGVNQADVIQILGPGGSSFMYVDDLYVCDVNGGVNNDFLGDVQIGFILPASDGDLTQWTPNSGSPHFSRVNENPPDGDTSYVASSTTTQEDLYHFQPVSLTRKILGLQTNIIARKDDEGNRALSVVTRSGGSDSVADTGGRYVNQTYIDYLNQFDVNPLTGLAWTPTSVNAAQWGIKLIA